MPQILLFEIHMMDLVILFPANKISWYILDIDQHSE